ncbi:hypothetical protein GE09DRAFT_1063049 [Coniochaeta sp. 2T2.1]|nr:hypothetical protein GE09DRAFT_1063049 [Coniochaeta sp. 2T2.1]
MSMRWTQSPFACSFGPRFSWLCFGDYGRASAIYSGLAAITGLVFYLLTWYKPPSSDPYTKGLYDVKAREYCLKLQHVSRLLSWCFAVLDPGRYGLRQLPVYLTPRAQYRLVTVTQIRARYLHRNLS